jgi:RNA polymerase primary sigma factor
MSKQVAVLRSSPVERRTVPPGPFARAAKLSSARLKFVNHPSFDDPSAKSAILAPYSDLTRGGCLGPVSLPFRLAPLPEAEVAAPFLSREQEAHLFRKMNYLKCRANRLDEQLDKGNPNAVDLEELERLQTEARDVKNRIVETNLPLVLFVVKKYRKARQDMAELVSEGNLALIQAVDCFDFARGNRFSTYATWAIRNALVSKARSDRRHRGRSFAPYETSLMAMDTNLAEFENEGVQDHRRSMVRRWFARLGNRERWILVNRYGLGGATQRTLAQLARELGISKQRVSQLALRAENKLRKIARRETLAALEI